jgi:hypothetical protein
VFLLQLFYIPRFSVCSVSPLEFTLLDVIILAMLLQYVAPYETHRGRADKVTLTIDLNFRWGSVVSSTTRPWYPCDSITNY